MVSANPPLLAEPTALRLIPRRAHRCTATEREVLLQRVVAEGIASLRLRLGRKQSSVDPVADACLQGIATLSLVGANAPHGQLEQYEDAERDAWSTSITPRKASVLDTQIPA